MKQSRAVQPKQLVLWSTLLSLLTACSGCGTDSTTNADSPAAERQRSVLRLASTTSTRDSGLLDVLLPVFEEQHNCRVTLIAVGTGAALRLGRDGEVDAVLVHARSAEEQFMTEGHGIRHEPVMHNFFLIAGPADDPAGIKGLAAADAFKRIAETSAQFLSRGDDSGTHKRELSVWEQAGGRPEWDGYLESGRGMGHSLVMADEKNAYILTDEATWIRQSSECRIMPLVRGADELKNPYGVMVVNPDKHPSLNTELANAFVDFLTSEQAQQLIADHRVDGQTLFHADRLRAEEPAE